MARICVGQITSTGNMAENLAQCRKVLQKAFEAGAKALFLPEASDYIGTSSSNSLELCQSVDRSPFVLGLQSDAKKYRLPISVGIHEPSGDLARQGRIKNTLIWIDEQGQIAQRYQKLHLFDLDIKDGPSMKESDTVEPGKVLPKPFDSPVGRIGAMICFDLRFPELALALKRQHADILLYPSAFTIPTGQAHWMPLLRARAIERQCYVVAAAQVGSHNEKRASYGHSVVIDPWGKVIAECSGEKQDEPEVIFADIDLNRVQEIRTQMPLLRRTDIYSEL
ncbi:hypothetical protein CKM354_000347000 [Cercospora kikuchii]|uniref:CN hydrolase domain-containing protein n=1 Tax=Cercospora kikuchii TaxID=84275 RepID=A0A9P3CC51_9PEZI|nr:uncharacterized protein CKM354_000347000 [Cercospora kikuchii]GIZ40118.1 hypothetical protein CKM354_000347000 [Cercospora kikuchii]